MSRKIIAGIELHSSKTARNTIVAGRVPDGELHGHGGQHERPDQGLPEGQLPGQEILTRILREFWAILAAKFAFF